MTFDLAEMFVSINGEGRYAGELAVFLRFSGCNLRCSYCDTTWVNESNCKTTNYKIEEILEFINNSGAKHVTVTGGEPLLQTNISTLFDRLIQNGALIEVETNGSMPLDKLIKKFPKVSFTMDYKMPSSYMETKMYLPNLALLRKHDTLKLVCGDIKDLEKTKSLIKEVDEGVLIFLSPIFGKIDVKDMVEFIIENKLTRFKLQLQLHKYIWDPNERGV